MSHRRNTSFLKPLFVGVFALSFFSVGATFLWAMTLKIPSIDGFETRRVTESTKIYDRTGKVLLYDVHGAIRRTVIPIDEISRHAKNATIAIEDTEFYQHRGIKPDAIVRAFLTNLEEGGISQGGSTITQQVIKNTVLSREKTLTRKIKEAVLALKLEREISKDAILEIYFNETPYGGTIYGIEEAAQYYFAKSAKELALPEAAYLAALPRAPTYYSPFGNHRDELEERKNLVLKRMFESGFITASEYADARTVVVEFQARDDTGIKAPHFVFFVREYLEEKYGVEAVNEGGLTVTTTLDYDLQKKAEEVVERYALENKEKFNAENAGLVAVDPQTGQILAMVGSRNYFDEAIDGKFNIALAKRQPGSAFKPFVYATAFLKGYTPETVVFDLKTQFSARCEPDKLETDDVCYSPDNYDNVFRGPVSLRNALAQSINIPAVKVLYLAGIPDSLETAHRLGITTLEEDVGYYGLPLVLGGGEVKLLDMVSAYGVFANDGARNPAVAILSIKDPNGEELEIYEENESVVLDSEVARTINSVLSDNEARTPAFGERSSLYFPGYEVAAKTGTTDNYRDAWVIGYTPEIVMGAWAGNNDNTSMEKRVAGFIVAPLWHEVMQFALERDPHTAFIDPSPKDLSALPPVLRGAWNEVGSHEILYSVQKNNPLLPATDPETDPQFALWEYPVSLWAQENAGMFHVGTSSTPLKPLIETSLPLITFPRDGGVVSASEPLTVTTNNAIPADTVSFHMNGTYMGTSSRSPFSISLFPLPRGIVKIRAVAEGLDGRMVDEIEFVSK